jgi:hypothetical protein
MEIRALMHISRGARQFDLVILYTVSPFCALEMLESRTETIFAARIAASWRSFDKLN